MILVTRNGVTIAVRDEIALAAFKNNGWKVKAENVETKAPENKPIITAPKNETPVITKSEGTADNAAKSLDDMTIQELRAVAKEKGINSFGKKAAEIKEELSKLEN